MNKLVKAFKGWHRFEFLTKPIEAEAKELNQCLREVGAKRQKALAKFERDKRLGTRFSAYSEDDQYLDDRFYQKKLQECYDQYTKVKRALGQS